MRVAADYLRRPIHVHKFRFPDERFEDYRVDNPANPPPLRIMFVREKKQEEEKGKGKEKEVGHYMALVPIGVANAPPASQQPQQQPQQ